MGLRAPVVSLLGRHARLSLARSLTSQATAQLSENPLSAAVHGFVPLLLLYPTGQQRVVQAHRGATGLRAGGDDISYCCAGQLLIG